MIVADSGRKINRWRPRNHCRLNLLSALRRASGGRLAFAARYLAGATALNLVWEIAQLPLYTIWTDAPLTSSLAAAANCTVGDLLIAAIALAVGLVIAGRGWPKKYSMIGILSVSLGIAYAIFSEWINVDIRGTWSYAPAMPRLPGIGTGLAPLLQWLLVPSVAFLLLVREARANVAG